MRFWFVVVLVGIMGQSWGLEKSQVIVFDFINNRTVYNNQEITGIDQQIQYTVLALKWSRPCIVLIYEDNKDKTEKFIALRPYFTIDTSSDSRYAKTQALLEKLLALNKKRSTKHLPIEIFQVLYDYNCFQYEEERPGDKALFDIDTVDKLKRLIGSNKLTVTLTSDFDNTLTQRGFDKFSSSSLVDANELKVVHSALWLNEEVFDNLPVLETFNKSTTSAITHEIDDIDSQIFALQDIQKNQVNPWLKSLAHVFAAYALQFRGGNTIKEKLAKSPRLKYLNAIHANTNINTVCLNLCKQNDQAGFIIRALSTDKQGKSVLIQYATTPFFPLRELYHVMVAMSIINKKTEIFWNGPNNTKNYMDSSYELISKNLHDFATLEEPRLLEAVSSLIPSNTRPTIESLKRYEELVRSDQPVGGAGQGPRTAAVSYAPDGFPPLPPPSERPPTDTGDSDTADEVPRQAGLGADAKITHKLITYPTGLSGACDPITNADALLNDLMAPGADLNDNQFHPILNALRACAPTNLPQGNPRPVLYHIPTRIAILPANQELQLWHLPEGTNINLHDGTGEWVIGKSYLPTEQSGHAHHHDFVLNGHIYIYIQGGHDKPKKLYQFTFDTRVQDLCDYIKSAAPAPAPRPNLLPATDRRSARSTIAVSSGSELIAESAEDSLRGREHPAAQAQPSMLAIYVPDNNINLDRGISEMLTIQDSFNPNPLYVEQYKNLCKNAVWISKYLSPNLPINAFYHIQTGTLLIVAITDNNATVYKWKNETINIPHKKEEQWLIGHVDLRNVTLSGYNILSQYDPKVFQLSGNTGRIPINIMWRQSGRLKKSTIKFTCPLGNIIKGSTNSSIKCSK